PAHRSVTGTRHASDRGRIQLCRRPPAPPLPGEVLQPARPQLPVPGRAARRPRSVLRDLRRFLRRGEDGQGAGPRPRRPHQPQRLHRESDGGEHRHLDVAPAGRKAARVRRGAPVGDPRQLRRLPRPRREMVMALPDRKAQPADRKALAKAIEDLLLASGAELDAETRETPARVAKAFSEDLLDGYAEDPVEALKSSLVPAPRRGELVIASQIDFHAMCPHHLLPYKGNAAVGY